MPTLPIPRSWTPTTREQQLVAFREYAEWAVQAEAVQREEDKELLKQIEADRPKDDDETRVDG